MCSGCACIIAKADDRSVATTMVSDYDAALADPSRVNRIYRVSHFLLGQDGQNPGEDFRTYARGGAMSERLRTEITAYQACMLDDSAVEGPHASVSRISKSAASVGAAWWSSTLRFIQNQSCMKVCNEEEADIFNSLFLNWKVLSQRSPLRYRKNIQSRQKTRGFLDFVYRAGDNNLCNFVFPKELYSITNTETRVSVSKSDTREIQYDYLRCVLREGSVYSFDVSDAIGSNSILDAQDLNSASPAEQRLQVVQIVCLGIAWKKYVFTDSVARMRAMKVPCVVQSYSVLREYNEDADLTELEVYADGHPEVIDCMSLASWKTLSSGITEWGKIEIIEQAGQRLSLPQLVHRKQRSLIVYNIISQIQIDCF